LKKNGLKEKKKKKKEKRKKKKKKLGRKENGSFRGLSTYRFLNSLCCIAESLISSMHVGTKLCGSCYVSVSRFNQLMVI